jgi:predicted MFS family arabinose efflux permease
MENILRLSGFARSDIVAQASLIGIAVLVGRLASGWLMDRFWAPGVALLSLCIPSAGYWLLAHPPNSYSLSASAVFGVGFAAGVEFDLMAFLIARYFGLKSYTTIYAGIYGAFALGSAIGPVIFGRAFDQDRNYVFPLTLSSGFLLISALLLLSLGRYRDFTASKEAPVSVAQSATNPA